MRRTTLLVIVTVAGYALLASACGGGAPAGAPVANAGGGTATITGPSGSGGASSQVSGVRYAQCMRTHGVANFPEPSGSGGLAIPASIDQNSSTFQAAFQACRQYAPVVNLTPAEHAQRETEDLSFARCMRSHGISDFPDPVTGRGNGVGFQLNGGSSSDLNSNNPAFQRAVVSCQHLLGHQFRFAFGANGVGKGG
jgi:hypothetical protein